MVNIKTLETLLATLFEGTVKSWTIFSDKNNDDTIVKIRFGHIEQHATEGRTQVTYTRKSDSQIHRDQERANKNKKRKISQAASTPESSRKILDGKDIVSCGIFDTPESVHVVNECTPDQQHAVDTVNADKVEQCTSNVYIQSDTCKTNNTDVQSDTCKMTETDVQSDKCIMTKTDVQSDTCNGSFIEIKAGGEILLARNDVEKVPTCASCGSVWSTYPTPCRVDYFKCCNTLCNECKIRHRTTRCNQCYQKLKMIPPRLYKW